jgi:excinuclease UvrABC helicase subunit UvrB
MSGHEGIEYFVSSKDYWIPETWVKEIKAKENF